ncbi:MAG: hypothetical protein ACQEXV_05555 [Bacillota bacterium]
MTTKHDWKTVGKNMKGERIECGMSQQSVGYKLGCSDKKVRHFEQGREIKDRDSFYKKYKQILNNSYDVHLSEPEKEIEDNLYEQAKRTLKELLPSHLRAKFEAYSFIAGGCVHSIYNGEDPNDYDFFLTNEKYAQTLKEYFNSIEGLEEKSNAKKGTYKGLSLIVTDNAITIGQYQIITQWVGNIHDVVSEFDFKHNQFYYYNGEIGTLSDFKYLDEKKLVYNDERGRNIGHTFIRTIKFVERGWTISHKELSKLLIKLNDVGLNENEIKSFNNSIIKNEEPDTYSETSSSTNTTIECEEDENYE